MKKEIVYKGNFTDYLKPLAIFNFLIAQWFFVRLARVGEVYSNDNFQQTGWSITKWILPLTGWWSDYKYIFKSKKKYIFEFKGNQNDINNSQTHI